MNLFPSKNKLKIILTCIVSGILLGLSFPPFKTWFLIYGGLFILIHLILTSDKFRQVFWRGWFTLLIFNIISVYWVGGWQGNDIFLKIGGIGTLIVHPLIMIIPIFTIYVIKKAGTHGIALLFLPFIWVGYEYFDNLWQFAFPWLELGNSEAYNINRIQYVQYIGVHGVTLIICSISTGFYYLVNQIFSSRWKILSYKSILIFVLLMIGIIFPNIYSYYYLKNESYTQTYFESKDSTKIVKAAIIQPNIDPLDKWNANPDETVNKYINNLKNALNSGSDLFVLNETALPYYFYEEYSNPNTNKFFDFVNQNNKYLMIGVPYLQYYPDSNTAPKDSRIMDISRRRYKTYNAAVLIEPGKKQNELQVHKKVKLVPFSENPPYKNQLPFLGKLIKWSVGIGNWDIGPGLTVFTMSNEKLRPKIRFETLICYESVFSDFARIGVKNGAEFIVIITNDGWFGNSSGPVQHQQFAVLRAIENRKWIIRCAQTGISCFIDPLGNVYDKIPINTEGIISKEIYTNEEKTFYSRYGDIIGEVGFFTSGGCIIIFILIYVYKRKYNKSALR